MPVCSLLNEPNTFSAANVDASVMYRNWKEKQDKEYEKVVR
jgi:ubiquitin-conjugating enzyme E2 R